MVLQLSQRHVLAATLLLSISCANAFLVQPSPLSRRNTQLLRPVEQPHSSLQHCACIGGVSSSITTTRATTTALSAKLWRRLEIEEDEEPMWYLLNCIAGLELDLLRQCRQKCADMPDALKFVVPIEKSTRSHGPNRIVTDVKVRYQGYVFGKLRLCEEVYEAVQELDLCRSWMGTVNKKGHQKLPPAPVALNEMEIENFGLEDLEEGMEDANDVTAVEEVLNEEGVILDTEETDQKILKKELKKKRNPKVDEEQLKEYMELRVDDMIKVTANNKFKGEDGIVKRLKNAQVMVRFFTYGSTYDEWLDPKDVRKMSNEEVMRGLSGPTAPVTQDDLEGGARDKWSNRSGPGGLRDALMSSAGGGGQRNTRQDRNQQKFRQKDMFGRSDDERKNWNWYQNERRGSSRGGARDGDTEIGVGSQQAQGDVDAQWGRFSKRQQRRDNPRDDNRGQDRRNNRGQPPPRNMRTNQNIANAIDGEDDWSSFVSSPGAPKEQSKSNDADDDFFNSLMSELNAEDESSGGGGQTSSGSSSNEDDDSFFSSLMSELNEVDEDKQQQQPQQQQQQQQRPPPTKQDKSKSEDYDFFAALEAELADEPSPTKAIGSADDADDFFAKLEAEMKDAPKVAEEDSSAAGGGDDFFANLEKELSDPAFEGDVGAGAPTKAAAPADPDDFFSQLETELSEPAQEKKQPAAVSNDDPDDFFAQLETELSEPIAVVAAEKEPAAKKPAAAAAPSTGDTGSLSKKKVPELKDMLRERGLKVSGKKAELIERLMQ